MELERVISGIDALCGAFGAGARIPSYRDLARRMESSVRTVLAALADLERKGRVVRRAGSGTYVAEGSRAGVDATIAAPVNADGLHTARGNRWFDRDSQEMSLVVVATHDGGYLSHAIQLAYDQADAKSLTIRYESPGGQQLEALWKADDGVRRGFIVIGNNHYDLSVRMHSAGKRVVYLGNMAMYADVPLPTVYVDLLYGSYLAVKHLIDIGHRRIAYIGPQHDLRRWGHNAAVQDARADGIDVNLIRIDWSVILQWRTRPELAAKFLSEPGHPTGLACWNDHDCVLVMSILQYVQIKVPEQISLVGYDNEMVSSEVVPALTTIDNRLEDRIRIAIGLLLGSELDCPVFTAMVRPKLVVRSSTGPPPE